MNIIFTVFIVLTGLAVSKAQTPNSSEIADPCTQPSAVAAEGAKSHSVHTCVNVAHRGTSYFYPENTFSAYLAAVFAGT